MVFSRSNEGGTYTVVHKTEHIKNNVNPLWKKFFIPVRTLCNGDYDRNIKVECFDHNLNGSHKLIGEFFINVRQLLEGPGASNIHRCINPKKKVLVKNHFYSNISTTDILCIFLWSSLLTFFWNHEFVWLPVTVLAIVWLMWRYREIMLEVNQISAVTLLFLSGFCRNVFFYKLE